MSAALKIRDASRFVIGTGLLRDRTIAMTNQNNISFDDVAGAVLASPASESARKLRATIEHLADLGTLESQIRNTPSHAQITPKIVSTREADMHAIQEIHSVLLRSATLAPAAIAQDAVSEDVLSQELKRAFREIDKMPGSAHEKEQLLDEIENDLMLLTDSSPVMQRIFTDTQTDYLEELRLESMKPFLNNDLSL